MKRSFGNNGKKKIIDDNDELEECCQDECCQGPFPEIPSFKMTGKFEGKIKFLDGNFEFDGKFDGTVESNQPNDVPPEEEYNSEEMEQVKKALCGRIQKEKKSEEEEEISQASDEASSEEQNKKPKKHYDAAKLQNPPSAEDCKTQ